MHYLDLDLRDLDYDDRLVRRSQTNSLFLYVCVQYVYFLLCTGDFCPDLVFIGQVFAYKCQRIIYLPVNMSKMLRDPPVCALSGQNFVDFFVFPLSLFHVIYV